MLSEFKLIFRNESCKSYILIKFLVLFNVFYFGLTVDGSLKKQYHGHRLVSILPQTIDHIHRLQDLLHHNHLQVDFWREPRRLRRSVEVSLPHTDYPRLSRYLRSAGIQHHVTSYNVQNVLNKATPKFGENGTASRSGAFNIFEYHPFDDIQTWLLHLERRHSDICSTHIIGQSYEGRDLRLIQIGMKRNNTVKPAIWIDGGIHAREWVAPATAVSLIHYLIHGYTNNETHMMRMLTDFDWYILPVSNPDGYAYTWTGDRLWRKTRSANGYSGCMGVDPNRNFDFHWRESGTSFWSCASTYGGPAPFSEPEVRAMANFILNHNDTIKLFIQLHSYGQLWLTPWGWTAYSTPEDHSDMLYLARLGRNAIRRRYRSHYLVGSAARMLYPASGGADDWAKGVARIKYSYTIELKDQGRYAFALPAIYIKPTSDEILEGLKTITRHLKFELDMGDVNISS